MWKPVTFFSLPLTYILDLILRDPDQEAHKTSENADKPKVSTYIGINATDNISQL